MGQPGDKWDKWVDKWVSLNCAILSTLMSAPRHVAGDSSQDTAYAQSCHPPSEALKQVAQFRLARFPSRCPGAELAPAVKVLHFWLAVHTRRPSVCNCAWKTATNVLALAWEGDRVKRAALLCLVLAGASFAQPVSIGVKAGVPITDFVDAAKGDHSAYFTKTKRYTIGPTVEFHLPARISIEIDALYKRFAFDGQSVTADGSIVTATRGNSWEFPVLVKLELFPGPVRPFVDAGASIRHLTGIKQVQQIVSAGTLSVVELSNPPEFNKATDIGLAFGAGIALKLGRVRISPELRYTRWGSENLRHPVSALLHTNRNEGDVLIGFTF